VYGNIEAPEVGIVLEELAAKTRVLIDCGKSSRCFTSATHLIIVLDSQKLLFVDPVHRQLDREIQLTYSTTALCSFVQGGEQRLAVGSSSGALYVLDSCTGNQIDTYAVSSCEIFDVTVSKDLTRIACALQNSNVGVVTLTTGTIQMFSGHSNWCRCVIFLASREDLIVSGSDDTTLRVWSVDSNSCERVLTSHSDYVYRLVLHPSRSLMASSSADCSGVIWDTDNFSALRVLTCPHWAHGICFLPDAELVCLGSRENGLIFFDIATGKIVHRIGQGNSHFPLALAYCKFAANRFLGDLSYLLAFDNPWTHLRSCLFTAVSPPFAMSGSGIVFLGHYL
jgi:WD40 repeat protein